MATALAAGHIDAVLRAAIWKRYEVEQPPINQLDVWVERISFESGVSVSQIRKVISQGAAAYMQALGTQQRTQAQQVADLMGAGLVEAFEVFRDGMRATRKRPLLDKAGRPKLKDPEGGFEPENILFIEVEDWDARLSAARSLVEVHGARAPQQLEIKSQNVNIDLSHADAIAELDKLTSSVRQLQQAIAGSTAAIAGPDSSGKTIEGTVSDSEQGVLDDELHQNGRRAGPGEPLQALPEPPVPGSAA